MPRKGGVVKRPIIPDLKYQDALVSRFINGLMRRGKKSVAQKVFYNALDIVGQRTKEDPLKVFHQAMDNVKPLIEVKSRRVGGATYQVPLEVSGSRQLTLALRWLVQYAKGKRGARMGRALAQEVMDAYNNQGASVKKRDDTHKMAQANKAFAHYRW